MNRFCIVANMEKDVGYEMARKIKSYLELKGKQVRIVSNADVICKEEGIHAAIVLGGDGTMIQASKSLAKFQIPLLGVNMGTLGFLTEIERNNMITVIDEVLAGDFYIQKRIALTGQAVIQGEARSIGLAMNDFIIGKRGVGRIITVSVFVNDELVDTYVADGILIATPTGSTAYNLSAGGPILSPEMEALIITPICPHALNKRSIVVAASDRIRIQVEQTRSDVKDLATISGDGQLLSDACTGDTIEVGMADERIMIMKVSETGFFKRMRRKLNRY